LECIEFFKEKNLDLLVRDCSCFGFPTYQVIVPGYSEVFAHRLSKKHNDLSHKVSAKNVLRRPAEATLDEILGFLLHFAKRTKLSLSYKLFTSFAFSAALSINYPTQLDSYMMAATLACVNYSMKRYSETIKYINKMLSSQSNPKEEYLICIKRYLSLLVNKYDDAKIKEILLVFHKEDTVNKLYNDLDNGLNIFSDFVLHCDGVNCQNCILKEYCCEKRVREIALLINTQTKQLDFDKFAENLRKFV